MEVEQIARVAHEANRAYCLTIGDTSQPTWEAAPAWQKDSAINGVKFRLANPHGSPADSHVNWLAQKRAEGWSYGPVKDPARKLHPCFLPYEELPAEQRVKDKLYLGVVDALLAGDELFEHRRAKHIFQAGSGPDAPKGCGRCNAPPEHEVHVIYS